MMVTIEHAKLIFHLLFISIEISSTYSYVCILSTKIMNIFNDVGTVKILCMKFRNGVIFVVAIMITAYEIFDSVIVG